MALANLSEADYLALQQEIQGQSPTTIGGSQEQVATSIEWSDESVDTIGEELDTGIPEVEAEVAAATDEAVTPIAKPEEVVAAAQQSLPKSVAMKTMKSVEAGKTGGIPAILAQLKEDIDKENKKRDAIALLGFGIALMGGKNATAAARFAQGLAGTSDEKVEKLYARRKTIMDAVEKTALRQAGLDVDSNKDLQTVGWEFSDGNVYFQQGNSWNDGNGNTPPADAKPVKKVGTGSYGDLSARLQGLANSADTRIRTANNKLARMTNILSKPASDAGWSGAFGKGLSGLKSIFGTQNAVSEWRRQVEEFIGQESLTNLPPGPASDRDIAIVRKAQVDGFANREAVEAYLAAVKRLTDYAVAYDTAMRNYIYQNRGTEGFTGPAYPGNGAGGAGTGTSTSSSDLDDILNS